MASPSNSSQAPRGKDWTDACKAGIDLRRWWIENEFTDVFEREERAAIMEFDGGLPRVDAERLAGIAPEGCP